MIGNDGFFSCLAGPELRHPTAAEAGGEVHLSGTLADRPEAGLDYLGRMYFATGGNLYQCVLSGGVPAWVTVGITSVPGSATPAVVQSATGTAAGAASVSATLGATTTAGNHLGAMVVCEQGTAVHTVTPPAGWSTGPTKANGTSTQIFNFYRENAPATGGPLTFAFGGGSPDSAALAVYEASGVALSSSIDQQPAGNSGASASPASPTTGTTAQANELLVVGLGQGWNSTYSAPTSSFTLTAQAKENTNGIASVALLTRVVAATGTYSSGATSDTSIAWAGVIATFKAA